MGEERHTHIDLAAWIERYFVDDAGPLRLEAFQRDILNRIANGERVVVFNARRNPYATSTIALLRMTGAVILEDGPYQAMRVWASAVKSGVTP